MDNTKTDTQESDLFSRYLEVCNRAIAANGDRFPFKQILGAAQKSQTSKNVEVCIIDDHPEASFVIHLDDGKVSAQSHSACKNCNCKGQWRVARSYLEDVIQNPDEYIRNPAKIDWEWMYGSQDDAGKAP
jgi:hypothetical protein